MKSGTGVFIASFQDDGYRVAVAMAIHNCMKTVQKPLHLANAHRIIYFGASSIYATRDKALEQADKLLAQLKADKVSIKLGIRELHFREAWPDLTMLEADKIITEHWRAKYEHVVLNVKGLRR